MQNPYVPPAAALAEPPAAGPGLEPLLWRVGLLVGYVITTGALAAVAVGIAIVVPRFAEVFKSFGGDLPALTVFVVKSAPYWGVLPLLSAAGAISVWRHRQGTRRYRNAALALLIVLAVIALAAIPVAAVAMYLPIWKLGEVG